MFHDMSLIMMQVMWMLRLSYNTYRRGLFSLSDEDYRWQVLRERIPKWFLHIVNFTFIGTLICAHYIALF